MNVHSVARAAHGTASFPSQGAVPGAIMGQQAAKECPKDNEPTQLMPKKPTLL